MITLLKSMGTVTVEADSKAAGPCGIIDVIDGGTAGMKKLMLVSN